MLPKCSRRPGTRFAKMGVSVPAPKLDLPAMMNFKQQGIDGNVKGVEFLMKKNKIDVISGKGKVLGTGKVEVTGSDGKTQIVETRNIVIATGSDIARLKGIEIDEKRIVSSTGALSLDKVPEKLLIVGAGVIGLELGSVWHRLGAQVTVVEFLDRILPGMDGEVAKQFQRILEKQGFAFKLGAKVTGVDTSGKTLSAQVEPAAGGKAETLEADVVLVAIGRVPYTEGLGLKEAGVALDNRGRVQIDSHFATTVKGVYAIGDVVAGPMLAHKAEDEGVAVAEILAGQAGHVNYDVIPGVVYTTPEVSVRRQDRGRTEAGRRGLYRRQVPLHRQWPLQGQPDHRRLREDSRRCEDRSGAWRAYHRPRGRRNDPRSLRPDGIRRFRRGSGAYLPRPSDPLGSHQGSGACSRQARDPYVIEARRIGRGHTGMMRRLLQPIWVLLAIIFLIEAWLWDHLEPIVAWFVALIPLRAFKQWLAERVDTLSPAMTLIVFIVPVIPLFPLKLVGLWLLTHEYWMSAVATIIFAKFLGVGVAAFVFDVTKDKLLEMDWFETLYEFVLALRAKATALVDPIKSRIRAALRGDGSSWSSRTLRLIQRFRKSVHEAR